MKFKFALSIVLTTGLLLAACGGGAPPPTEVDVVMTEFSFTPNTITVAAGGQVTVNLTNSGTLDHNFVIMEAGSDVSGSWSEADSANIFFEQIQTPPGENVTATFTAPTESGEYQILCSVSGHLEGGMEGTLIVTGE